MPDEQSRSFTEMFNEFVVAYEYKEGQNGDKPQKPVGELLQETLQCLEKEGYTKQDIMFALGVEPLTVERWFDGRVMRDTSYTTFKEFGLEIARGKPQRVINVSDTALVTWRYVLENRQAEADRIWYISDGRFLLSRSPSIDSVVRNLFTESYQQKRREPPVIIYLYPPSSETEAHLRQWETFMRHWEAQRKPAQRLKGCVIGIPIQDTSVLPWFLPGIRAVLLEKEAYGKGRPELEGYIRVRLPDEQTKKILEAMATPELDEEEVEDEPHIPWLQVHRKVVNQWYRAIEYFYLDKVKRLQQLQKERDDFQIMLDPFRCEMDQNVNSANVNGERPF